MKKATQEQIDNAIDAVNDCYDSICDAQHHAREIQRVFGWSDYGYRLAEDLQYHLRLAEQILADLGDNLQDTDDDDE